MREVSEMLSRIGASQSSDELLPIVYAELRRLANARMHREIPGNSIQPTELVHEAYLRLTNSDQLWDNRDHFFAAAAEAMRRILVERARARKSQKRGGDRDRVELHDSAIAAGSSYTAATEVLVVNELLDRLAAENPQEAEVAKLCYFADFNVSETARALKLPVSTAHKRWNFAKAWLRRELKKGK